MNLDRLAALLDRPIAGLPAPERDIRGVAPFDLAGPTDLTFVADARLVRRLAESRAGALLCTESVANDAPLPCIVSPAPAAAFARATRLFHPRVRPFEGIHPTASIDPTARLGPEVAVGPFVVIGPGADIGSRVEIHAHTTIYANVTIGEDTIVHAGSVLREGTVVGARCVLQPNVVLGSDGFGFPRRDDGSYDSMPQLGTVVLEDDVDVGAGSTIDRATFGSTRIGKGTKIDNLVQIGHNCSVGENGILCAQVGLAGSTTLGRNVILAGQVGVAGHLEIGDGAVATAQTGIPARVAPGAIVSGYPAIDSREWRKSSAVFTRLPELQRLVRTLERRIAALERAEDLPETD